MFRKLLVPLDGSPLAEQALGQAAAIARASHAEIDLALVHQPLPFDGFGDAPWNAELWNDERRYLESVAAELSSGSSVPVTHAILRGEAIDMICRRIADVHADFVVMTSHGRTGLSRTWLGSVANGVLRHSAVPVLMLRPVEGRAREIAAHHLFKRILVPLDGSSLSADVLPATSSLAECSDAQIWLLRVVQPVLSISPENMPVLVDERATERLADRAKEQVEDVARRVRQDRGIDVETHVVVEGGVAAAILDFARTHGIDAIAMSTHGRGLSRYLVGSVADKVLRGSGVPMLLSRPLGIRATLSDVESSTDDLASVVMLV